MLTQLVTTVIGLVLCATLGDILLRTLGNWRSQRRWRKKVADIPEIPGCEPLSGHLISLILKPRYWRLLADAHASMGSLVRLFHRDKLLVSCLDLDLIKRLVVDEQDKHINRCDTSLPMDEFDEENVVFAKGDKWRRIRQATAPAFTRHKLLAPNVVAEFEGTIDKFAASIRRKLEAARQASGRPRIVVDTEELVTRFALSLGFTCFYKRPQAVDFDAPRDAWTELIIKGYRMSTSRVARLLTVFPTLNGPLQGPVRRLDLHPFAAMVRRIFEYIRVQTRNNLEAKRQLAGASSEGAEGEAFTLRDGSKFRRNLMDYVIDRFHEGKLTERQFMNTSYSLIHASAKTIADALVCMLAELARNPAVQARARAAAAQTTEGAEYLDWFILECLRLHPPVLGGCPRTIESDVRSSDGRLLPEGASLITPAHIIHRMPEYWGADADELKPERWAKARDFHPCQYLAFGAGRRACLGREFALVALRGVLGRLLREFVFAETPEATHFDRFQAPYFIFRILDTTVKVAIELAEPEAPKSPPETAPNPLSMRGRVKCAPSAFSSI